MCHQAQNVFRGIFIGIPQHQKGYLVYIPITCKIVSTHGAVFDETFSSALEYTHHVFIQRHSLCDHQSRIIRTLHHIMRRVPSQDVTHDLIILYVSKIIYLS